jgi:hypothetical protein
MLGSVGVFVGLAGVSCALTLLFLGMRAVMNIGGTCASGQQPYVVAHPCPAGVALLLPASIWGGLIFLGLYVWQTWRNKAPSLLALAWPTLFLSLGWNFLEFGLRPPGGGGVAVGWLVCAVVFGLMGGIPLLSALPATVRTFTGRPPKGKRAPSLMNAPLRPTWTTFSTPVTWPSPPSSSSPRSDVSDVVSELERLAALHRSGELDDAQYEAAKRKVLGEGT